MPAKTTTKKTPDSQTPSSDVTVPAKLIDQVVGQEKAVTIIKKAAAQKRNVLLVGSPGTGKSLLAQAMSELLPVSELEDILVKPNPDNENTPKIVSLKKGEGRKIIQQERLQNVAGGSQINIIVVVFLFVSFFFLLYFGRQQLGDVITAALLIMLGLTGIVMIAGAQLGRGRFAMELQPSKLLVDNSKSNTAPFMEATGARAGALLGDVRHDPFQSFCYSTEVTTITEEGLENKPIGELVNGILDKKETILTNEKNNYEAAYIGPGQFSIVGECQGKPTLTPVLSINRYDYTGNLVRIVSESGKELLVSPEHPIAIQTNEGITYKAAKDINPDDSIAIAEENTIIDQERIIQTYSASDQEQTKHYFHYRAVHKEHPDWGYKRIAKHLKIPFSKTRFWHNAKHKPKPMQSTEWLAKKRLLPLGPEDARIRTVARILGTIYGDGGIFTNRNAIFLSSAEREVVEKFGQDLELIFGVEITKHSRIIEGGEKGHSWCYQNTHRGIIRFFEALGAPIGNKSKIPLAIPSWIHQKKVWEDEFFGSFLANEMGTPKIRNDRVVLTCLEVGITATAQTKENRLLFLRQIEDYLARRDIQCTSIYEGKTPNGKIMLRLLLKKNVENILNFLAEIRLDYSPKKEKRIRNAVQIWIADKKAKYEELNEKGIGAERIMKRLHLSPRSLYQVLNA